MTNPLPPALASLIMPYTSVPPPSRHRQHMEMVIAISYREVGEITILAYTSQKLNVVASREVLNLCSAPGRQIPHFTKGKWLSIVAESTKEKRR